MEVRPDEQLDEVKIVAFMKELRALTVRYGIILEGCDCGGGLEPMLAPNHILEDEDWQYIRTPEEFGGHFEFSPADAYDKTELEEETEEAGGDYFEIEVNFDVNERLN